MREGFGPAILESFGVDSITSRPRLAGRCVYEEVYMYIINLVSHLFGTVPNMLKFSGWYNRLSYLPAFLVSFH